jgi:hypothetical protein
MPRRAIGGTEGQMGKRLTDIAVARLNRKAKGYVIWDAAQTGLGIKVTPRGKRIWVLS